MPCFRHWEGLLHVGLPIAGSIIGGESVGLDEFARNSLTRGVTYVLSTATNKACSLVALPSPDEPIFVPQRNGIHTMVGPTQKMIPGPFFSSRGEAVDPSRSSKRKMQEWLFGTPGAAD